MIRQLLQADCPKTARLHYEGMPNEFLPGFGTKFLELLHRQLIAAHSVTALTYDTKIRGFVIATTDVDTTMKQAVLSGFFQFLPYVLLGIIRRPKTVWYILQTLTYSSDNTPAELLVLSVDQNFHRRGIGTKLVHTLCQKLAKQGVAYFRVGTLAGNAAANALYKKCHGAYQYSYTLYGKKWNVYHVPCT